MILDEVPLVQIAAQAVQARCLLGAALYHGEGIEQSQERYRQAIGRLLTACQEIWDSIPPPDRSVGYQAEEWRSGV